MRTATLCLLIGLVLGGPAGCSAGSPESPEAPAPIQIGASPADTLPVLAGSASIDSLLEAPTFTPFTVRPDIKNRAEVARALEREYPRRLRDAGIGGTVHVWLFVDAEGVLRKTLIDKSSGEPALDVAARAVARMIEFPPAFNRGKAVPVWISLPITFTAR
ncbi:MAG: energy transducer TonB [Gemmatimonadota bacterium]